MASFRCYDNSDVIKTLLMKTMVAIFPNVCLTRRSYSQNWEVLTLKNIASSHLHMPIRPTLLHRMALVSFLLFRKNLGNLREFFGQMVYRPPLAKKLPVRLWCHTNKYPIKQRLHLSLLFISTKIELSTFNLKLFSWNSIHFNEISVVPVWFSLRRSK